MVRSALEPRSDSESTTDSRIQHHTHIGFGCEKMDGLLKIGFSLLNFLFFIFLVGEASTCFVELWKNGKVTRFFFSFFFPHDKATKLMSLCLIQG